MVLIVVGFEVLVTGPAFKEDECAGSLPVRERAAFKASWVVSADRLQSVEGFLRSASCPAFTRKTGVSQTSRQDFTALALMSMEVRLGAMEGRDVDRTPIAPTLVVRKSSTRASPHHSNSPEPC